MLVVGFINLKLSSAQAFHLKNCRRWWILSARQRQAFFLQGLLKQGVSHFCVWFDVSEETLFWIWIIYYIKHSSYMRSWEDKWLGYHSATTMSESEQHCLWKRTLLATIMEMYPLNLTFAQDLVGPWLAARNAHLQQLDRCNVQTRSAWTKTGCMECPSSTFGYRTSVDSARQVLLEFTQEWWILCGLHV
jgi:hypothetical protein